MEKQMLAEVVKQVPGVMGDYYVAHEGTILPWLSIVTSGAAVALAVKESRYVLDTIDAGRDALASEPDQRIRKSIRLSIVRDLAPKIAPIVGLYLVSVAATLINKKHTDKKIADLTASLGLMTNAVTQYQIWQKEAEKELGKEKTEEVTKKAVDTEVKNNPPTKENTVNEKKDYDDSETEEMWHYLLHHTGKYIWSNKSPEDIKGWCNEKSADLYEGAVFGDSIGINSLYEFLTEDMAKIYRVPPFDDNKDLRWYADDGDGQRRANIVNVESRPTTTPSGHPIIELNAVFYLPFR